MAIRATLSSPLLRRIKADMSYVFAVSFKRELAIDDNGSPLWQIAEGRVAAHMIYRLYADQSDSVRYDLKRLMTHARIKHPYSSM